MNRGGVPALNYYNLVRPQLETQGSINLLDQRTDVLGQTLEEGRGQPLITGQASQFMTHNRYFFSFGSRATQPRAATMQPAVMTPSRSSGR
jgi:hypothetical protein